MAYTWVDNELVTAEKLNNYGSGLEAIKQDCEDAKDDCESAQTRCEQATVHQPIVQNNTWWTWNQNTSAYVDTTVPATGQTTAVVTYQEGTSGTTVPTGTWTASIPTVAQGNYLWTKTVFNGAYTTYSVARQGVDGSGAVTSVNGQSGVVTLDTDDIPSGATNKYVTSAEKTTWNGKASKPNKYSLSLPYSWTGTASPYTQTVTISGATITNNSKVDIQPSNTVITQLINDGCNALCIENDNTTLTAYAFGEKPSTAITVQVTVTEVD